ncbi:hypothetical protein [Mycobacteroides abscessus]|uniref:hypothetical protein n=1 Tax=Mycobacteroides abscessus TaxID=36809 RepID=UPI00025882B9|nr:hypothetical protein [Mycobacteroides abscessus]EIC62282.1 hypothetical protein S7W_24156 [Mycobacteroides abscessus M94]SKZ50352.1 Uncharacterised protein [Mycobacteroides abscessus subsp. abscessus]
MTYYPNDPRYGQPQPRPQGYVASDPLYVAKRRMQGWWGATAALFVLGIVLSAAYSASLTPSTNPYIHTMTPTSLSYVLLAIGLINGVLGTAAFVIAIKATRDHGHAKRETYGRY